MFLGGEKKEPKKGIWNFFSPPSNFAHSSADKNAGRKQKEGGGEEIVESFATSSEYLDQHESSSRILKCAVGWAAVRRFFF